MPKNKYDLIVDGEKIKADSGAILLCDNETGQGYVKFEDYFLNKSTLFRLDCLQDFIEQLQDTYNELIPVWEAELEELRDQRALEKLV